MMKITVGELLQIGREVDKARRMTLLKNQMEFESAVVEAAGKIVERRFGGALPGRWSSVCGAYVSRVVWDADDLGTWLELVVDVQSSRTWLRIISAGDAVQIFCDPSIEVLAAALVETRRMAGRRLAQPEEGCEEERE